MEVGKCRVGVEGRGGSWIKWCGAGGVGWVWGWVWG